MSVIDKTPQDGNDPWERCDICDRKTHPNEIRLYKGICADCATGPVEPRVKWLRKQIRGP